MDINYISGFFDADGCIALGSKTVAYGCPTSITITFSNTNKKVIEEIKKTLLEKYNIETTLREYLDKRENRSDKYDLRTNLKNTLALCRILNSNHSVKKHKIDVVNKYYEKVFKNKRNLMTEKDRNMRIAFNRLFYFNHVVSKRNKNYIISRRGIKKLSHSIK